MAYGAKPDKNAPLGQGGRFAALKNKIDQEPGYSAEGAAAAAAAAGRKKYGQKKMTQLSLKGRMMGK